jgi:hypothetical protein
MTKPKLLASLALVFILASCISIADSSVVPLTHKGDLTYTPMATGLPFPFSTPTPTPSPTPEPTVTPVPTPKPEPTAKPTMEIYCKSTAAQSNLKVEVTGTLTYNKTGIPAASIYIGYSADSGNVWQNFTLVQTQTDGGFAAIWNPNATGNYLVTANWEGNSTLHWVNATANLVLTPDSAGNLFSVVSNSTVTDFAYNTTAQQLSFNTNGTQGTTGYVYACIPKTLVSDSQTLGVTVDGKSVAFTSESHDDVWVISCVYTQSEHVFIIQIPPMQILSPATSPWIVVVAVIAVLVVLVGLAVVIRRRRRTAATVAAILKENRPVH